VGRGRPGSSNESSESKIRLAGQTCDSFIAIGGFGFCLMAGLVSRQIGSQIPGGANSCVVEIAIFAACPGTGTLVLPVGPTNYCN
jgi:hypothetical protein